MSYNFIDYLTRVENEEFGGAQTMDIYHASRKIFDAASSCIPDELAKEGNRTVGFDTILRALKKLDNLSIGLFVLCYLTEDGLSWVKEHDFHIHNCLAIITPEYLIKHKMLKTIKSCHVEIEDALKFTGKNKLSVFKGDYGESVFSERSLSFNAANHLIKHGVRFPADSFLSDKIQLRLYQEGIINDFNRYLYTDTYENYLDFVEQELTRENEENNTYFEDYEIDFFKSHCLPIADHAISGIKLDRAARRELIMAHPFKGKNIKSGCYLIYQSYEEDVGFFVIPIYAGKTKTFNKRLWDHWCRKYGKSVLGEFHIECEDKKNISEWEDRRNGKMTISPKRLSDIRFVLWNIEDEKERMFFEHELIYKCRPLMNKA